MRAFGDTVLGEPATHRAYRMIRWVFVNIALLLVICAYISTHMNRGESTSIMATDHTCIIFPSLPEESRVAALWARALAQQQPCKYLAIVCCSAILHREVTSAIVIMGHETQMQHQHYD